MTTVELLREAKHLIAYSGWTQGCSARNLDRKPVAVSDPAAVAFCATGAIERAAYKNLDAAFDKGRVLHALAHGMGGNGVHSATESVIQFNDALGRTVDQVLTMYDRAIAWAERREL
jgi:hypothetical protein